MTHKELILQSMPLLASMAMMYIVQFVDRSMISTLGTEALAAIGLAIIVSGLGWSFVSGLMTSVQKRVALTDDKSQRSSILMSALVLGIIISVPINVLLILIADVVLSIFVDGKTHAMAVSYVKIISFCVIFSSFNSAFSGFWLGALRNQIRFYIVIAVTIVAVIANIILIPIWGVAGSAWGSVISVVFSCLTNLGLLIYLEGFKFTRPKFSEVTEQVSDVFGVTLHQLSLSLSFNVSSYIVSRIGVDALAISNIVTMLALPAIFLGEAYGSVTGSFSLKSWKAGNLIEVRKNIKMMVNQLIVFGVIFTILIYMSEESMRTFFFSEEKAFSQAYWPILLLSVLALVDVACMALQKFHILTDDIKSTFKSMTLVQWLVFFPTSWVLVTYYSLSYTQFFILHICQRALIDIILLEKLRRKTKHVMS